VGSGAAMSASPGRFTCADPQPNPIVNAATDAASKAYFIAISIVSSGENSRVPPTHRPARAYTPAHRARGLLDLVPLVVGSYLWLRGPNARKSDRFQSSADKMKILLTLGPPESLGIGLRPAKPSGAQHRNRRGLQLSRHRRARGRRGQARGAGARNTAAGEMPHGGYTVRHRGLPPRVSGFPLYVARRRLEPGGRRAGKGMRPFPAG
jgi:hypothetical protein